MNTFRIALVSFFAAALALGCSAETGGSTLSLTLDGLEDLGEDYVYENWLILDGSPVAAGRFTVDADGVPSQSEFAVDPVAADNATAYVLTIEPAVGDDPAPSSVHILAGEYDGNGALAIVDHEAALGTDFSAAAGQYILETPTSGDVADDFDQGVWFLVPGASGMSPGLDLPTLPEGWTYEGWVVGSEGPVSTGTFDAVDAADSDGAGPDAGPDGSPAFPGQDFIDPEKVLTAGYATVISVEPVPDNSPAPFTIKPLADMDMEVVMAPDTQTMENIATTTLPSVTVTHLR